MPRDYANSKTTSLSTEFSCNCWRLNHSQTTMDGRHVPDKEAVKKGPWEGFRTLALP